MSTDSDRWNRIGALDLAVEAGHQEPEVGDPGERVDRRRVRRLGVQHHVLDRDRHRARQRLQ